MNNRKSIRLKNNDYTRSGAYFITICSYEKEPIFGIIKLEKTLLNTLGILIREEWLRTGEMRANVIVDEFIIMPNHIHGILILNTQSGLLISSGYEDFGKPVSNSIPTIVRLFKSSVTRRSKDLDLFKNISCVCSKHSKIWQRNYYERIIRNEKELNYYRSYIRRNPLNWDKDEYFT